MSFYIPEHIKSSSELKKTETTQNNEFELDQYSDDAKFKFNQLKQHYNPIGFTISEAYKSGFLGEELPLRNKSIQLDTGKDEQVFEINPNDKQWYTKICSTIADVLGEKNIDLIDNRDYTFDQTKSSLHKLYKTPSKSISFRINNFSSQRKIKDDKEMNISEMDKHNKIMANYINEMIDNISEKISKEKEWQKYSDYNNVVPLVMSAINSKNLHKETGKNYEEFFRDIGVKHMGTMIGIISNKVADCVKNVSNNISCHYKRKKKYRKCSKKTIKRKCKKALTFMNMYKWFCSIRDKCWGWVRTKSSCYMNSQKSYKPSCHDTSSDDDMFNDSDTDSLGSDSDSNSDSENYFNINQSIKQESVGLPYNPMKDKRLSHIRILTLLRDWHRVELSKDTCPVTIKGKGITHKQLECVSRWLDRYNIVPIYYKPLDDECLRLKKVSDHIFYDKDGIYFKYNERNDRASHPYKAIDEIAKSLGENDAGVLGKALIGSYGQDLGNPCTEKCKKEEIPDDECKRLIWEFKKHQEHEFPSPFSRKMNRRRNYNEQMFENGLRNGATSKGPMDYDRDSMNPSTRVLMDCVDKKEQKIMDDGDACPLNTPSNWAPFRDVFDSRKSHTQYKGPGDYQDFTTKKFYTYWEHHKDKLSKFFSDGNDYLLFAPDDKIIGDVLSNNPTTKEFKKFVLDHSAEVSDFGTQTLKSLSDNHQYNLESDKDGNIKIQGKITKDADVDDVYDNIYILPVSITSENSNN